MKLSKFLVLFKLFLGAVILGGIIFLIFFNPYFKITDWEIEGAQMADEIVLKDYLNRAISDRAFLFPKNNFFTCLFLLKDIKLGLKRQFPEIKNVQIKPSSKNWLSAYKAVIREREKIGIWCADEPSENCFLFDKEGVLFRSSPESRGPFILTVNDGVGFGLSLSQKISEKDFLLSIVYLENKFRDLENISINNIKVINQNYDFIIYTKNGWQIYFDPKISPQEQFRVFDALLKNGNIKPQDKIDYIDLRVKNKAFVKRL